MPRPRISILVLAALVVGCGDDNPTGRLVPPQTRIAFVSTRQTIPPEIYLMNADGTDQKRLTFDGRGSLQPSWAPDGSYIVFQRQWQDGSRQQWGGIFRIRPDGTQEVCIDSIAGASLTSPRVSPDGSKIVFCHAAAGTQEIWVMNANGSGVVNLTPDGAFSADPDWSPDGTRIVYARLGPGGTGFRIYTMKSDGSDTVKVVETGIANSFQSEPRWSRDGTKIVYVDNRGSQAQMSWIYVVGADGSNPAPVTPLIDGLRDMPSWSPDGRQIAYRDAYRNGGVADAEIYTIGVDGSGMTNASRFAAAHDLAPDWGPP